MGLFRFLAGFDWITPVAGWIESAKRGEMGNMFQYGDAAAMHVAMARLRSAGIETWAHGYDAWSDTWYFNVSDDDCRLACNMLGV